jgi:hypothetical protein
MPHANPATQTNQSGVPRAFYGLDQASNGLQQRIDSQSSFKTNVLIRES